MIIRVNSDRKDESGRALRWGFVGTGVIAESMANTIALTERAELVAVCSRRLETAETFAARHNVSRSFDSWEAMCASDEIDAVYVANPTGVREEVCICAAENRKHVLGEKPFASLSSLKRIVEACRRREVAFMDATHLVHHPRTLSIQQRQDALLGWPWSVCSAFLFEFHDHSNIRYDPVLEPMGALGDAGWYNMRAAVEFLSPEADLVSVSASLRREPATGAVIAASGLLSFDDGSTSTWNCGFDCGSAIMDLRIAGTHGSIYIDDFLSQSDDNSGHYLSRKGGWAADAIDETIVVPSSLPASALMFEDMAAAANDDSLREHWMKVSLKTQQLLDASWQAALAAEWTVP